MCDRTPEISPLYIGEWIRDSDLFVRFGGDAAAFQCVVSEKYNKTGDDADCSVSVSVIGPELNELESGNRPLGFFAYISGIGLHEEDGDFDVDSVIEKSIPDIISEIQGVIWTETRDNLDIRISKNAVESGLTLEMIGEVAGKRICKDFPCIGHVRIFMISDPEKAAEELEKARAVYSERDIKALSLHDEDVDEFFVCRMCQNGCPDHICVITPDHPSVCGTIGWLDAKAAARVNPEGHISGFLKKKCLDPSAGEYEGINETAKIETSGKIDRIALYDIYENPHTTGDCVEIIAYAVPGENGKEDGIGLLDRQSGQSGILAANGLTFDELKGVTAGGKQIPGFQGIGFTYLRSPKFMQKSGGLKSVCLMTESLKEKLLESLSGENRETVKKIPTEKQGAEKQDAEEQEASISKETNSKETNAEKKKNVIGNETGNKNAGIRIKFGSVPEITNENGKTIIRFRKFSAGKQQ